MKKYVLTGGPSIGKTTMIELLAARGYATVPEAARIVIEEERIARPDFVPRHDLARFQERVFRKQLELESAAAGYELAFLDRGVVDGAAYCKEGGVPIPDGLSAAAANRYEKIFLLDSLGVYEEDGVRSRTLEDAQRLHQAIIETYTEFGYALECVPVLPPDERVNFILTKI